MRFHARALRYYRPDLPLIVGSLVLVAVSTLASLLNPFLLAILIDTIFQGTPSGHWIHRAFLEIAGIGIADGDKPREIVLLAGLAVVLRIVQEILTMGQRLLRERIGYNGLVRIRCDLFRKLQQLSLAYHHSQPQGDAIYRLSYDTGGFSTILNVLINNVLVSGTTLVLMTLLMLQMNWRLTLVTLAVAPPLMLTTRFLAGPLKRRWIEAKETESELTTMIQRGVSSIGLVQAFGREADEYDRFNATARGTVRASLRQAWHDSLYWLLIGTIFGVGYAVLFGYGGWLVWRDQFVLHRGEAGLTLGSLVVFLAYVNQVYGPLQALGGSGASIQSGVVGAQRVFEVLDRQENIRDSHDARHLPPKPRTLSFQSVGFEYRTGEPVLRDIDLEIPPGKMIGVVGSSGVGKTTLLNLLPRFYDPTSGAIRLDGIDIRQIKIRDLRSHVALVLQENIILPTTVSENIAYGRPRASEAEIEKAAELAGAAQFIARLPQRYQTVISESGANLSGGQRQRIAIARALLTEAPILVFDEPTSALDPQHEAWFIETLQSLRRQRTIMLVSHRMSTVRDCDEIVVLENGRIIERGGHDQLVASGGVYHSMASRQIRRDEPVPTAPTPAAAV